MSDAAAQIWRLLEVGRTAEARKILGSALAATPGDPTLHCCAAQVARAEGNPALARQHLHEALSVAPESPFARFLWFELDVAERRYVEAEQGITALIREQPGQATFLTAYADLMLRTLHLDRARALVAEALRLEPQSRDARRIDVLLATIEGQRDRAGHELAKLIREDPQCGAVANTLLVTLIERKRPKGAVRLAERKKKGFACAAWRLG